MYALMGIIAGALLSMQTAANARLRSFVKSPYVSALISCIVSLVLAFLLLAVLRVGGKLPGADFSGTSWWMFLGGFFGVFVLTGCIILFPILGAVQTTVLPLFGQILLGALIDFFGWFGSAGKPFSLRFLAGIGILAVGIVCVVILPEQSVGKKNTPVLRNSQKRVCQAAAVLIGMASAAQATVNGRLGRVLGSPLYAAVISISTVVILALLINLKQGTLKSAGTLFRGRAALWAFPGGVFGVVFILLNASLAPVVGTGSLMVFSVAGQLLFSLLIERFGWFYAQRKAIRPVQILGLLLIMAGVVMVEVM